MDGIFKDLRKQGEELQPKLIRYRRDFHAFPELRMDTPVTEEKIVSYLRSIGISEIRTGIGGHGVAAMIRGSLPGKCLAVRSDADGLPIREETGLPINTLQVDGGACANDFLMQFQSDVSHLEIRRPRCIETTALGAAYLAGLAVGYWTGLDDVRSNWAVDRIFTPELDETRRRSLLDGWHKAVKCALMWGEEN